MILLIFSGLKSSLCTFVQLLLILELPVTDLINAADEVGLTFAPQFILMFCFFVRSNDYLDMRFNSLLSLVLLVHNLVAFEGYFLVRSNTSKLGGLHAFWLVVFNIRTE